MIQQLDLSHSHILACCWFPIRTQWMSGHVFLGIVLQKKKSILLYFFLKIKEKTFRFLIQLIQFIFTKAVKFTVLCLLIILYVTLLCLLMDLSICNLNKHCIYLLQNTDSHCTFIKLDYCESNLKKWSNM